MRSTQTLYPLESNIIQATKINLKQLWKNTLKKRNDVKDGEDLTFDQLLKDLDISEKNYILTIRSSLNCPTIYLRRKPNEVRINNYNPACLSACGEL